MKITVLGYMGGYPDHNIGTTGYLIQTGDYNLLLDAGSGVLNQLEKIIDPLQLDAVLLTHYHNDHIADVGVLQYLWQLKKGNRKEPLLPIYGHFQDPLNFNALNWPNSTKAVQYSESEPLNLENKIKIEFLKTVHPVPAFATRITEIKTGKVLSFTADTTFFDEIINFVKKSDLLITDTNFLSEQPAPRWHLTTKETARIFNGSDSKKLLLSHLNPQIDPQTLLKETQSFVLNTDSVMLPKIGETFTL